MKKGYWLYTDIGEEYFPTEAELVAGVMQYPEWSVLPAEKIKS